jgi:hypothetical protein
MVSEKETPIIITACIVIIIIVSMIIYQNVAGVHTKFPAQQNVTPQPVENKSDYLVNLQVYDNPASKEPLWSKIEISANGNEAAVTGYGQDHYFLTKQYALHKITITGVLNNTTGISTPISNRILSVYVTAPEYHLYLNQSE